MSAFTCSQAQFRVIYLSDGFGYLVLDSEISGTLEIRVRSFAVIPAAGRSSRMGTHKLLMAWRSGTVIQHVLRTWLAAGVDRVVVVMRPDDAALREVCQESDFADQIDVVRPAIAPPDMKTSVVHGLDFLDRNARPGDQDVWLLAPADMPTISESVIQTLIRAHCPENPRIILPVYRDRRGHPVLFPWKLADQVRALPADAGIDQIVRSSALLRLDISEPGILQDLDTPSDYERAASQFSSDQNRGDR